MADLRNMTVGISFRDEATAGINRVNAQMDSLASYFSDLGGDMSSLRSGFDRFGQSGQGAMDDIRDGTNDVSSGLDDITDRLNDADRGLDDLRDNPLDDLTADLNDADRATGDLNNRVDDLDGNLGDLNNGDIGDLVDDVVVLDDSLGDATDEAGDLGDELADAGHVGVGAASGLVSAFLTVASVLAAVFAVDKIKDFGTSIVEAAGEAEAEIAQFEIVFGNLQGAADKSINGMADDFGMLPTRLKATFTKTTSMFKGFGMSTEDSMEAAGVAVTMAADAAAFFDVAMSDSSGALTSFLKGNTNAAESIGIYATAAGMASFASEELGLSWKSLDEGGKQLVRLKYIEGMQIAGEVTGQAARESEGYENILANLHQAWFDLKKGLGMAIFDKAITGMQMVTEWIGKVDTDAIVGKFQAFSSFMSDTFGPVLSNLKSDLSSMKDTLQSSFKSDGMQTTFDTLKTGMQWIGDNWPTVKETVIGLGAAFIGFKAAMVGLMIIDLVKKAMASYQRVATTMTVAQWALNAAMTANPISLVAVGIGALIGVGVLLWRNWDTVTAKTKEVWDSIGGLSGAVSLALGPIGFLINAGIDLATNWDNTKSVWENVWGAIQRSAATSVNAVIGLINEMIGVINKIPGVNIPIVAKVDWGQAEAGPPKGMAGISNAKPDGSHSDGLASVPYDNYLANLHRDESVLTAEQSNGLRSMGILQSAGGRPVLNLSEGDDSPKDSPTAISPVDPQAPVTSGGSVVTKTDNHNTFEFHISGENAKDIATEVRQVIEDIFAGLNAATP